MESNNYSFGYEEMTALIELRMKQLPPIHALEPDDVISRYIDIRGEYLDRVSDGSNMNWLRVCKGCTVEEALREYAAVRTEILDYFGKVPSRVYPFFLLGEDIPYFGKKRVSLHHPSFLRVTERTEIPEEKKESLRRLCEENEVRIIEESSDFCFRDLLFDCSHVLMMLEYPGSADDAATNGEIWLNTILHRP